MAVDHIEVRFDTNRWKSLLAGLTGAAMQNAWRRALRKTMTWVSGQVAREVSAATRIPQKVIRDRLLMMMRNSAGGRGNAAKVWLGLNALEVDRFGKARQTPTGVTVGRHQYPGAWMKKKRDDGKVFRRIGRDRIPYERVTQDWEGEGEASFQSVLGRIKERLLTLLEQEINYELQKAAGNA
ncbi:MAG: hypothetical protein FWC58_05320 [Desulfobulbus sp.]|nr:hypothetical protein [Desulfobulbus sp.]